HLFREAQSGCGRPAKASQKHRHTQHMPTIHPALKSLPLSVCLSIGPPAVAGGSNLPHIK
ncbi:hypothetical protein KUCAC02_025884, partial [Chaenocephalus aceratus]